MASWERCYNYSQRLSNLPKITQLENWGVNFLYPGRSSLINSPFLLFFCLSALDAPIVRIVGLWCLWVMKKRAGGRTDDDSAKSTNGQLAQRATSTYIRFKPNYDSLRLTDLLKSNFKWLVLRKRIQNLLKTESLFRMREGIIYF